MTQKPHFDVHPDAESLNAFAERALGEREREQVLAHLAVCSRCREVVFLAQGMVLEMGTAVAAANERAAAPKRAWWRSWRIAWVPVGVVTMAIATAYVVHVRHLEKLAEMAKVPARTERQLDQYVAKPAPPEATRGKEEGAHRAEKAEAEMEAASRKKALAPARASASPTPAAPPAVPVTMNQASNEVQAPLMGLMAGSAAGSPARELAHPQGGLKNKAIRGSAGVASGSLAAKSGPGQAARQEEALDQDDRLQSRAAVAQMESAPALSVSSEPAKAGAAGTAIALYKVAAAELPSGLPALSTATAHHSVLAVDKAGNVFLSGDAGVHWDTVARQWNGRAVAVRAPAAVKEGGAGSDRIPEILFELVNDQGQVWVSTEGKTWKTK